MMQRLIPAVAILATASPAAAQVAPARDLTLDGARRVLAAAVAHAKSVNAPGSAIAVVDFPHPFPPMKPATCPPITAALAWRTRRPR